MIISINMYLHIRDGWRERERKEEKPPMAHLCLPNGKYIAM